MYPMLLVVHSWLRWIVLLAGLWAVVSAARGLGGAGLGKKGLPFLITADLQLVVGLLLYMTSPITGQAMGDMGAAMKDPVARFWAVEHATGMVLGLVALHVGYALAKRGADPAAGAKKGLIGFGLALLAFLLATPWPWMAAGRDLFRL